jgi:hypothetical protein
MQFISENWWWVIPLGIVVLGVGGYALLWFAGLLDWISRGSH